MNGGSSRARRRSSLEGGGGQGGGQAQPARPSRQNSIPSTVDSYDQQEEEDYDSYEEEQEHRARQQQQHQQQQQGRRRSSGGGRGGGRDGSPPTERGVLVRALFDFKSSESSSLNFQVGDVIEILGQLESGWWDGVFEGERGWLPSNYVAPLSDDESAAEFARRDSEQQLSDEEWSEGGRGGRGDEPEERDDDEDYNSEEERHYQQQQQQQQGRAGNGYDQQRPGESPRAAPRSANEYWVPRVTTTGQIYYLNTLTGATSQDLPSADSESDSGSLDDYPPSPRQQSRYPPSNNNNSNNNHSQQSNAPLDKPPPSPTHSNAESFSFLTQGGGALPLGGGFGPRLKAALPHPWVSRMTDDGAYVYYLNPQTGERRRDPPINPSGPISVNRTSSGQDFDSRSVSPASANQIDLNRDILDDDSDLDVAPPPKVSTSSSTRRVNEGPVEESRRRMREIEDRLSSSEPEGIPVLALKVRTTIRALRDALAWRADPSQTGTTEGDDAVYEACKRADENLTIAKSAVVAATRCLIVASGVLAPSSESLDVLAGVASQSSQPPLPPNSSSSPTNPIFVASEQLKFSHRKVTTSLTRLTFSVRHFQHTTDWITTDEDLDAGVHSDAEDVERVVVAFGLEAERERSSRVVSSSLTNSTNTAGGGEYKPRRLEGWLDSIGVGLPVGGRNGFSTEIDADLLVRPFGIDASEAGLRPLQAKALKAIATLETLFTSPSPTLSDLLLPVYSDLIRKVTLVQQHVRSFNIATSLDLDGEEEPSPTETVYAALVLKANERLRDYEDALDALHDRAGFLMAIRGFRSDEECRAVVGEIQSALLAIVPAFLGLWEISFAQAQAVRNGTKGRIGLRRPAAPPPSSSSSQHVRSNSRLSMTSVRSRGSIGSRRSHLLSLRGKGGGGAARGLDEEVLEKELADEEELRDQVDARAFAMAGGGGAASSTASTSQVSIPMSGGGGGRARQGSLSALSSASSVPSFVDMSAAMEAQSSRLSGGGKGAMEALGMLRSRRESDDAAAMDGGGAGRTNGKLNKFFGSSTLPAPPEQKPWFVGSDLVEGDLVMVEGEKDQVKGGTLPALVVKLTMHDGDYSGHSFRETFLMTHKSFATPQQLLSLLRDRFYLDAPEGVGEEELQRWVKEKQLPIRLKVLNVIKIWISDNHMEAGDEIVGQIEQFANGLPESLKAREGLPLIRAVQARKLGADGSTALRKLTLTQSETPPPSFLPPNRKPLKLTDLDPLELARQLTLMDAAMYNRIRPVECLQKAWSDLSDPNKAANIKAVIKHSNQVSNWVKAAILSEAKSPKMRAVIIKFFVSVAERCLNLHNFSTVAAIVAGLESSLILRLKRTFEVLSPKTQASFQVVSKAVDPDKNFSVYRDQLSKLNPPSVPFLGVYLTFLTFIEDGNPNFLQGETPKGEKLINFGKRMKSAGVLREMQTYQSVPYNLAPVAPIQSFVERQLKEAAGRTEDELYLRSLELEPREEPPERITRMLEESGFM